jgi:hypothetical protein
VNLRCIFNGTGDALGTLMGILFSPCFFSRNAYDVIFCPNNVFSQESD